jgi:hypothetical protein
MLNKPVIITVIVEDELKTILEKYAREDDRPLSSFIRRMLEREAERLAEEEAKVKNSQ